jgi:PadR family transcriptional regulator, regulatory protein AphA
MSIKHAILGFLSWQPYTGYELKKLFAESDTLSWSGNSNQIYKTLVEIHQENLVTLEVQPQADKPPRKIYTITEAGLAELKSWLLTTPQPPLQKNPFQLQLAWANQLETHELLDLLASYEEKLRIQLAIFRERDRRKAAPNRTPREAFLWQAISENWTSFYENEIRWIQKVRDELRKMDSGQE